MILISIDTLRGDRISPEKTPGIYGFSNGGTLFTSAETQVPLTLPSHTVLFTSTYPFENGVEENAGHVPATAVTLASVLRANGYRTAAFIGSIFLERQLGLDKGFDTWDSPFSFEAFSRLSGEMLSGDNSRGGYTARERRSGPLVLRAANQWLDAHTGQPAFVFVHLFDMHKPWQQPSYDSELQAVDRMLGGVRDALKKSGWWDRSLVILLSDHGEGLGDHGESDHGYFIYESTMHVPLIFHWPQGMARMPARVEQPVGLIDVAPSILEFLKISAPAAFRGRSFLDGSARAVFGESVYARDAFGWAPLRSVRAGADKYIDAPKPELFNLVKDPRELTNTARAEQSKAAAFRKQIAGRLSPVAAAPHGASDPQRNREVLESLGYLAPGPHAVANAAANAPTADPKDRLPELLLYERALSALAARKYEEAIRMLRGILAGDAGNLLARRDLGVTLVERGSFSAALPELQRVAGAAPDDYVTRYELGLVYEKLNNPADALNEYEAACRTAPGAVQCADAVKRIHARLN